MVKQIRIDTMEQVLDMISVHRYREDLKRYRDLFIYRGEENASFTLSTSLKRNCKSLHSVLEGTMLQNFTKYAVLEEPMIDGSVWNQMILGQHHGFPTRLLDWSFSPLMALHFATDEKDLDKMEERDGSVWQINIHELHGMLPNKYKAVIEECSTTVFSVDMLTEVCNSLSQYDEDMGDSAMLIIEPPSLDRRIIHQYSFFSIIPSEMEAGDNTIEKFLDSHTEETVRYIIDRRLRWQIRDMLDHLNISERLVYPGLDGLSRWLGRHYFVRD